MCETLHAHGIRVVLDGVFNHVGRGFWAFKDVQEKKWDSSYKDWFHIHFDGNSNYNDGFWYESWEGHFELVKLNLRNPAVVDYLLDCVRSWVEEYDIDGLRLDVAYCLDHDFLRRLRQFTNGLKPEFFLVGETLHGDYNQWVNDQMLHSCTNYECYKGLYSSLNSMNLFEIVHSLKRQFGPENWTLYKGKHLLCFCDNHDVTRVASILQEPRHLPLIYGLMFGMPGIPCLYYGSEWGAKGEKRPGSDDELRPCFEAPEWNDLTNLIAAMAKAHRESDALCHGDFQDVVLTNCQTIFQRRTDKERVLVAINADSQPYVAHFNANCGRAVDLITGKDHDFGGGSELPPTRWPSGSVSAEFYLFSADAGHPPASAVFLPFNKISLNFLTWLWYTEMEYGYRALHWEWHVCGSKERGITVCRKSWIPAIPRTVSCPGCGLTNVYWRRPRTRACLLWSG